MLKFANVLLFICLYIKYLLGILFVFIPQFLFTKYAKNLEKCTPILIEKCTGNRSKRVKVSPARERSEGLPKRSERAGLTCAPKQSLFMINFRVDQRPDK